MIPQARKRINCHSLTFAKRQSEIIKQKQMKKKNNIFIALSH